MGTVTAITGGTVLDDRTPNPACIEGLRALLEMAESGEIQSVTLVHINSDCTVGHGSFGGVASYAALGALHIEANSMAEALNA